MIMTWTLTDTKVIKNDERELFSMLDRGIDDMEAGRELSVDEACKSIRLH